MVVVAKRKKLNKNLMGVGLRPPHFHEIRKKPKGLAWLEVISENYLDEPLRQKNLLAFRKDFDISLHGVSMNIASADELSQEYFKKLKNLIDRIEPVRVSDHLCWTGAFTHRFHDLLPFPYNEKSLDWVSRKVNTAQDILQRELILENLSSYLRFDDSEMSEIDFMIELNKKTGCFFLLDINNVYVNATNHGFDPSSELAKVPKNLVKQVHLAGFSEGDKFLIDTHSNPVHDSVWKLFEEFYSTNPHIPYCVEWDDDIPDFSVVYDELIKAQKVIDYYA